MPIIHMHMGKRPNETIDQLGKEITETVARVLDVKPNTIRILFHETTADHWFVAGMNLPEYYEKVLIPQQQASGG